MKNIALIILIAVIAVFPCEYAAAQTIAQTSVNGVRITDMKLTPAGDQVQVAFRADVENKAVRSDYTLTLTPVLANGANRTALEPVVVQGRRAKIQARREARSSRAKKVKSGLYTTNGRSADYRTTVPYQSWMEGATLTLESTTAGCCTETAGAPGLLAQNLVIVPPAPVAEVKPEPKPKPEPRLTTAERLARDHRFLAPIAELGDGFSTDPDRYIDTHRDGSLAIYFKQGLRTIDRSYKNNDATIDELLAIVREIQNSDDSRVVRVVIAGFASPEGSTALNDRLANDRAATAQSCLVDNTTLEDNSVDTYNGGVDWRGLRMMVAESDMEYKQQILDIIDNTPVWNARRNVGRLGELMRLKGGEPYRDMFRNFFPELRNAAYIRVYYENK